MSFWKRIKDKYLGDRAFYSAVLALFIPIVIQNGISSFVNRIKTYLLPVQVHSMDPCKRFGPFLLA